MADHFISTLMLFDLVVFMYGDLRRAERYVDVADGTSARVWKISVLWLAALIPLSCFMWNWNLFCVV